MLKVAAGISGAALSPWRARLPRGLPRGFRPQASEPTPRVGSRGPALAIRRGDAARLESDRLRRLIFRQFRIQPPQPRVLFTFLLRSSAATIPGKPVPPLTWSPSGALGSPGAQRWMGQAMQTYNCTWQGKRRNERHRASVSGSPTLMKPSRASRASCVARTGGSGPPADRLRWPGPTADPFAPGGDPGSPCPRPWPRAPTGRRRTPP